MYRGRFPDYAAADRLSFVQGRRLAVCRHAQATRKLCLFRHGTHKFPQSERLLHFENFQYIPPMLHRLPSFFLMHDTPAQVRLRARGDPVPSGFRQVPLLASTAQDKCGLKGCVHSDAAGSVPVSSGGPAPLRPIARYNKHEDLKRSVLLFAVDRARSPADRV